VDLGSETLTTTSDFVQRVRWLLNVELDADFDASRDRPNEPVRVARVSETRKLIGWEPQVDLESGLNYTVAWFRERYL
jgi:nucleoside-diphosphate-sugar epimerase